VPSSRAPARPGLIIVFEKVIWPLYIRDAFGRARGHTAANSGWLDSGWAMFSRSWM
jgi:hypothetical protein